MADKTCAPQPSIDDALCCHICYDYYKHPKRLSQCRHSYCVDCLRKMAAVAQQPRVLNCPECRQEQMLDDDGVDGLDTDTELDDQVRRLKCADCEKYCKTTNCDRCHVYCCDNCIVAHKRKENCPLLEQFRRIETKLPNEKELQKTEILINEWERYQRDIPKIKVRLGETIDKYIEMLQKRKDELNHQLDTDLAYTDVKLKELENVRSFKDNLEKQKTKLGKTINKKEREKLREENERMNEMLENLDEVLKHPRELRLPQQGIDNVVQNFGHFVTPKDGIEYSKRCQIRRIIESDFQEPVWDVAICPLSGNICATEKNHVRVLNPQGRLITRFYTGVFPARLTVNNQGQIIVGHFREHRVRVYDQQGQVLFEFGESGEENGNFRGPRAIYCDSEDNMYVADMHNHRIALHKRDGTFIRNIGETVLAEPLGIALNSRGEMYVTDTHNNSIYKFDKNGVVERRVAEADDRDINEPMGIWIDEQDNVLVCNNDEERRVEIFNKDLEYQGCLHDENAPFRFLLGVVINNEKDIIISDYGRKEIFVF